VLVFIVLDLDLGFVERKHKSRASGLGWMQNAYDCC